MADIEAVIWCPQCKTALFQVERVKADSPGVFEHRTVQLTEQTDTQVCACGTNLERRS